MKEKKTKDKNKNNKSRELNKIEIKSVKIDDIHTRYVKKMGNGAIIYFLKEHIGKKVYIIIPEEKENKKRKKA